MFINKPTKNQQINIGFFLPFTILMIVIVISLTSIMYYNYQETTLPIIYDHISENLEQSSQSASYMMQSVNNLLSQMSLDSKITTLMYSSGAHNALELRSGQKALSSFVNASPFVHSIYVYNSNLDSFFTSLPNLGLQTRELFFDDSIFDIMENYDTTKKLTPIPRQVKLDAQLTEGQYINCYTFIYYEITDDGRIKDAIIVNVNQAFVADLLSDFETDVPNSKLVIDNNGMSILDTNSYELLDDLSSEHFVQIIMAEPSPKGYFVTTIDESKSLVSFSKLSVPEWTLVNITPFTYLTDRLSRIRIVSLIIALFLLFVGIVASTLLSRYKYRPIKQVLDNVSTLEANSRRNYYGLRQATLRKLIRLGPIELTKVDPYALNRYNIQMHDTLPFHLLIISIDDYRTFSINHIEDSMDLTKFSIINIVNEIIRNDYPCESIDMLEDNFLVIINGHAQGEVFNKEQLHTLCRDIINTIDKLLKVSTTIVNGPSVTGNLDLTDSYLDIKPLLDYRLTYGNKSMIDYDEIAGKELEPFELDRKQSKALVDYVINAKSDEAYEFYTQLIKEAKNCTAESIRYLHMQLAFVLNDALTYIRSQNSHLIPDLAHLIDTINSTSTLDELSTVFNDYFLAVAELINLLKQPKHQALSGRISTFIQENYMDINLSLNMVADFIKMSPMYTGRLFKQQTSTSIANHINDVRLTAAEELLKNTNHNINEIADMIGVNNSNYFYSLFKKKHGVTPNVYRKENHENH